MRLNELNDLADRCFKQGDLKEESFRELIEACMPFFLYFRKRNGFSSIPVNDVREELAAEAISKAFISYKMRNGRSSFYLLNAFRDCCRERAKTLGPERIKDMVDKFGLRSPLDTGRSTQPLSPTSRPEETNS